MNLSELLEQQTNETVRRDSAHIERGRYSSTRTPVIMLMDISKSISLENKSVQMNEGAQASMREMRMDRRANNSCDFAALTFNDTVKVVQPFAPLPECPDLSLFRPDGRTKIAEAVLRGLAEIDAQEQKYQQNDTPYHCPMLWIFTDGKSVGETSEKFQQAAAETTARIKAGTLKVFAVAIGTDADCKALAALAGGTAPLRIENCEIAKVMHEVSDSVISVSHDVEYLLHGSTRFYAR